MCERTKVHLYASQRDEGIKRYQSQQAEHLTDLSPGAIPAAAPVQAGVGKAFLLVGAGVERRLVGTGWLSLQ